MSYGRAKGWQTKPKPGCFIDPTHPLSRGLVGCWLFNEGAGSRLTDISGYGNHGALTNMDPASDWVGSPRGGALDFDGSNDAIIVPNKPIFNDNDKMSLLVSFRSNVNTTNAGIVGIWSVGAGRKFTLYLGQDSANNKISFLLCQSDGTFKQLHSNHTYSAMEFIHVAAIADGNAIRLYKNKNVDATTLDYVGILSSSLNMLFGRLREVDNVYPFNGLIEGVWLYNLALPYNLISLHYNQPYANILSPAYRRYFIPVTVGGVAAKAMHQYRQRRVFV